MSWALHRHDARRVSELLEPESVDLLVTSPPYFSFRSYRDECEACVGTGRLPTFDYDTTDPDGSCPVCNGSGRAHYDGQLGSEATPGEFIDNLIACTADWLKVLKPTGSLFVNLGDKFSGSGGHNNNGLGSSTLKHDGRKAPRPDTERQVTLAATRRNAPDRYNQTSDGIPPKSRMGLPWRYAIRCIDELGLILRADIIWEKVNHLPESAKDRVQMSHEYLFHFTRQGRYFAAVDEVREAYLDPIGGRSWRPPDGAILGRAENAHGGLRDFEGANPLGKSPGSVWQIASEPLSVPDHLGVQHFAAFPSELVRRCVLGWSPSGWCTACGEARRPVVDKRYLSIGDTFAGGTAVAGRHNSGVRMGDGIEATITGYACACPTADAPTTPAVVLDPFAGTGTTVLVADQLGRHGIGVDLSNDYLRLAEWRIKHDTHTHRKVRDRSGLTTPQPPKVDGQLDLFGEEPVA